MNGFAWYALLIWALSWFTSLGFSWTTSLTSTLRGIAGGLDFMNISSRVLYDSLYPFPILDSGLSGAGLCIA